MNRERLTILRDHLASLPDKKFDMSHWCGSAYCIGGWTNFLFPPRGWDGMDYLGERDAETALGLTSKQGDALFYAMGSPSISLLKIDTDAAVSAIQSMLDNPSKNAMPVWPEQSQ